MLQTVLDADIRNRKAVVVCVTDTKLYFNQFLLANILIQFQNIY
jgi:hypothetical protein